MFDRLNERYDEKERIEAATRKHKEYHKIGSQNKVPGHSLFSYNKITGELKLAEFFVCDSIDFWTRRPIVPTRVIVEKDCVYIQALNRKNAIKRLSRDGYRLFN